jgi:hypothetical protein
VSNPTSNNPIDAFARALDQAPKVADAPFTLSAPAYVSPAARIHDLFADEDRERFARARALFRQNGGSRISIPIGDDWRRLDNPPMRTIGERDLGDYRTAQRLIDWLTRFDHYCGYCGAFLHKRGGVWVDKTDGDCCSGADDGTNENARHVVGNQEPCDECGATADHATHCSLHIDNIEGTR